MTKHTPGPHPSEQAEVNARLIDAAPDLLAALKAYAAYYGEESGIEHPMRPAPAAIAKLEDKQEMAEQTHSPLPWTVVEEPVEEETYWTIKDANGRNIEVLLNGADARLIVRACNWYDRLLKACKMLGVAITAKATEEEDA